MNHMLACEHVSTYGQPSAALCTQLESLRIYFLHAPLSKLKKMATDAAKAITTICSTHVERICRHIEGSKNRRGHYIMYIMYNKLYASMDEQHYKISLRARESSSQHFANG